MCILKDFIYVCVCVSCVWGWVPIETRKSLNILELKLLVDIRPSHPGQQVRIKFRFSGKVANDLNHWLISLATQNLVVNFSVSFHHSQSNYHPLFTQYNHFKYWLHQHSLLIYYVDANKHLYHGLHLEVRRQLAKISSLLLLCGLFRRNLDFQAWRQVPTLRF